MHCWAHQGSKGDNDYGQTISHETTMTLTMTMKTMSESMRTMSSLRL